MLKIKLEETQKINEKIKRSESTLTYLSNNKNKRCSNIKPHVDTISDFILFEDGTTTLKTQTQQRTKNTYQNLSQTALDCPSFFKDSDIFDLHTLKSTSTLATRSQSMRSATRTRKPSTTSSCQFVQQGQLCQAASKIKRKSSRKYKNKYLERNISHDLSLASANTIYNSTHTLTGSINSSIGVDFLNKDILSRNSSYSNLLTGQNLKLATLPVDSHNHEVSTQNSYKSYETPNSPHNLTSILCNRNEIRRTKTTITKKSYTHTSRRLDHEHLKRRCRSKEHLVVHFSDSKNTFMPRVASQPCSVLFNTSNHINAERSINNFNYSGNPADVGQHSNSTSHHENLSTANQRPPSASNSVRLRTLSRETSNKHSLRKSNSLSKHHRQSLMITSGGNTVNASPRPSSVYHKDTGEDGFSRNCCSNIQTV